MSTSQQPASPAASHVLPEHEDNPDTFHIFVLVKTTRHWLDMPTEKRRVFLDECIRPLLRQRPEVAIRWFEPEAFTARATDIMVWRDQRSHRMGVAVRPSAGHAVLGSLLRSA
jgi:darcynin-like uncharacterized protein